LPKPDPPGAVFANEGAVDRFLAGELPFLNIARVCRAVLDQHNFSATPSLDELTALDQWARREVDSWICARAATGAAVS
jgi:1-deoxy-D-xylulose-5-phosphate reductoisomerase